MRKSFTSICSVSGACLIVYSRVYLFFCSFLVIGVILVGDFNIKRNGLIMTVDEIKGALEGFGERLDEIRGYL